MTRISIVSSWLCATGVVVFSSYCILTHFKNTQADQKKAAARAEHISKRGTISEKEFKRSVKHSSAVNKKTVAKIMDKDVKEPVYVPNPIYPPFTNALNNLVQEFAAVAQEGDVVLTNGFTLTLKDGKPVLKFPEAYERVRIGGKTIGEVLADGDFSVSRKRIGNTDQWEMDGIGMYKFRRLDEPEFYCTDVTYSALPATKQIDSIRMHGKLGVVNTSQAYDMVEEITKWMQDDFGAVDLKATTPAGTLALKKFRIGEGMDVEVVVNWDKRQTSQTWNSKIDITFKTRELEAENKYQRAELGKATDKARASTYSSTGVNYFTVNPKVNEESVKKQVVY